MDWRSELKYYRIHYGQVSIPVNGVVFDDIQMMKEGTAGDGRTGRQVTVHSFEVRGHINSKESIQSDTSQIHSDRVRIILAINHQKNRTAALPRGDALHHEYFTKILGRPRKENGSLFGLAGDRRIDDYYEHRNENQWTILWDEIFDLRNYGGMSTDETFNATPDPDEITVVGYKPSGYLTSFRKKIAFKHGDVKLTYIAKADGAVDDDDGRPINMTQNCFELFFISQNDNSSVRFVSELRYHD